MSAVTTPRQSTSKSALMQQTNEFDKIVNTSLEWAPSKPSRSRGSSGAHLDPSEEWAKLFQAAERRKIQNRNAQRKYRRSLKKRLESLEEQGAHVGSRSTSSSSASSQSSASSSFSRPHAKSNSSSSSVATLDSLSCPQDTMEASQPQSLGQMSWMTNTPDMWSTSCTPNWNSIPHFDTPMQSVEMQDQTSLSSYFDQYPDSNMSMGLGISEMTGTNPTQSMCQADLSQLQAASNAIPNKTIDGDLLCPAPPSTPYSSPSLMKTRSRSPFDPPAGVNPLHLAAMRGFDAIVRLLLEQGAEVNELDASGCTALHLAVENGHQTTVQVLLDHGADFTVKVQ